MIGNDIVDLSCAQSESNWQRRGFLSKIFTKAEQQLIQQSDNSFETVWLIWSMKESAYKIYVRKHSIRFFAPTQFDCMLTTQKNGKVLIKNEVYETITTRTPDFIHTIAVESSFQQQIRHKVLEIEIETELHLHLKEDVASEWKINDGEISIKKTSVRAPELFKNNGLLTESCSLSHHGKYGAYTYTK